MRTHARVVVVGGGIVGASVLFRLAERGVADTVLLERATLTSGSTWHAAGLLPVYSPDHVYGRFIQETLDLYTHLQEEKGEAVGLHLCGQLRLASTKDRMDEYRRYMGIHELSGVEAHLLTPAEVKNLWPLIDNVDHLQGALYHPKDGHTAPADACQVLIRFARKAGAEIQENTVVTAMEQTADGEWRVTTSRGEILCEHVVTATGSYARETGRLVGLSLPVMPVVHQYVVTESVPEIQARKKAGEPEMPVLRDDKGQYYLREERDGFMFGPYDPWPPIFGADGVPEGFAGQLLPADYDVMEDQIAWLGEFVPAFGRAGVQSDVSGPIAITPDKVPLAGPAPGLNNYWLAEGFSGGVLGGPGVAKHLVNWILDGDAGVDTSAIDPRRYSGYPTKRYLLTKSSEAFGHNFALLYPDEERDAGRPLKTTPVYDRLTELGCVWGAIHGWEVPMWFAPDGVEAKDVYSFRRSNWYEQVADECRAVRHNVGLLDLSHFGKYEITGPGAEAFLDGIVANRLPQPGHIKLCHLLTPQGKLKSELSISRLDDDVFYIVGSPRGDQYNLDLLQKAAPNDGSVQVRRASLERGTWVLSGPKARDVLADMTDIDLSNSAMPWFSVATGEVGMAEDVRVLRVGFTGELGYELHAPLPYHRHLLEALLEAGASHGLKLFGSRALRSLRLEKSYRSFWVDIGRGETPLEAGMTPFIKTDKPTDFVGRAAVLAEKQRGVARQLVSIEVDPDPTDAGAGGNEAVYDGNGNIVGHVTSGGWCHHLQKSMVLALLDNEHADVGTELFVPVLGEKRQAKIVDESPYDPDNVRCRA